MGRSYSSDLRVRIYGEIEQGGSRRSAALRFGVSASTSVRLAQRMAATGSLEPARQGRPPGGGKLAPHAEYLIGLVEKQGDITMPELAAKLKAERKIMVHPASLSRFLIKRGYSVKKPRTASVAGMLGPRELRGRYPDRVESVFGCPGLGVAFPVCCGV
ncbi:transposase (plasmid) [Azospirillum sp. B510]|nr:transposase [Azospirillum sp. B510]